MASLLHATATGSTAVASQTLPASVRATSAQHDGHQQIDAGLCLPRHQACGCSALGSKRGPQRAAVTRGKTSGRGSSKRTVRSSLSSPPPLPPTPPPAPSKSAVQQIFDSASNALTNLLKGGDVAGLPTVEGDVSDLVGRPLFFALNEWFMKYGGIYRLSFGPKSFLVVSDPIIARHVLRDNPFAYDKGVLAEILEPIMGKGLIPADLETWKVRRRVIVPGFHAAYLDAMVGVFGDCAAKSVEKLEALLAAAEERGAGEGAAAAEAKVRVEMESEFSSLALDIIGLSVFNFDFGSITRESPIIQAVYGTLSEAEHRSTFYIPYWNLPFASLVVPRQRKFQADLKVINECLDGLIERARATREEDDLEALQERDYSQVKDASLLRFLVDIRGEDCNNKQLRDDLMTMLIAGHETTAAVLTWATFMLAQNPSILRKAQQEVDSVLGDDRQPTLSDLKQLQLIRLIVAESLRLFPQPPLLIRRTLQPDTLPAGHQGTAGGYSIPKGTDIFIAVYNINRSPYFWDKPDEFDPERFLRPKSGEGIEGWDGFDPTRAANSLYPNEIAADFAFLPFGGGPRKCVGDQFALMESTVGLAMLLRKFKFELAGKPEDVGIVTGATMHTKDGLWCNVRRRARVGEKGEVAPVASKATA